MSTKYYIRVGNMFFKDFGEDGTEPTFVFSDLLGWENYARKYDKEIVAEVIAEKLGGVVMTIDDFILCSQDKKPNFVVLPYGRQEGKGRR